MSLSPLTATDLRRVSLPEQFPFETTADLEPGGTIIGQPRGTRAIEFGIEIHSHGYNIFVLGETGTGRVSAIRRFLQHKTSSEPVPPDWIYVYNYDQPHRPHAIRFAPGGGTAFRTDMEQLLTSLRQDLPQALESPAYREAVDAIEHQFEDGRSDMLAELQAAAQQQGSSLVRQPSGLEILPFRDGQVMTRETFQNLPAEEQRRLNKEMQGLNARLEGVLFQVRDLESEARKEVELLSREVASRATAHSFDSLRVKFAASDAVLVHLDAILKDVLDHTADFLPDPEREAHPDLSRYQVNVLVDNGETPGVPVIFEPNPSYANLIGRIEYEQVYGAAITHFTNIKAGTLHRANGGYLVLNATDLLRHGAAWETLKRALKEGELQIQSPETLDGRNQVLAKSLDPEAIPLDVKVILLGSPRLYYDLYETDEDFRELFKVKADFDSVMPRTEETELAYAHFIASRCRDENLHHFDRSAVAKIVEAGSRLCAHQGKLSARFGLIADLVRETHHWADRRGAGIATAEDVRKAIEEQTYRANEAEERVQEQFDENTIMVTTTGQVIGQINGLAVLDQGDYLFGQPSRITAQTYMGEEGVVNIDREVEMAGPLHNKGLLTLIGYLGGTYAQDQPLSLSASVSFEQNYGGVEGDSASSAELYALLSRLAGLPINQGRAVTGSVNQRGEVQPIGGVTEKIEGFFKLCQKRGLTGDQGALIPAANIRHLMVSDEVLEAVTAGKFHVWVVRTIDEGIELLMAKPAGKRGADGRYPEGTVHSLVQTRLRTLAEELKQFGEDDDS